MPPVTQLDGLPTSRLPLPGPQKRGTAGTLKGIKVLVRSGPPANFGGGSERGWQGNVFARPGALSEEDAVRLNQLVETMLPPQMSGYTAYTWHEQGMCRPEAHGKYVPTQMGLGGERLMLKISARAVQELIAGKLSHEKFQHWTMNKDNQVCRALDAGMTITSAGFEPKGDDEDDDYLVFEFRDDPSARALRMPETLKEYKPS